MLRKLLWPFVFLLVISAGFSAVETLQARSLAIPAQADAVMTVKSWNGKANSAEVRKQLR